MRGSVFCVDCRHWRPPRPMKSMMSYRGLSPGLARAAMEELQMQAELREIEWQRTDNPKYHFDRPPQFQPYCGKYTLEDRDLARLKKALRDGDAATIEDFTARGFSWTVDAANGEVRRVYDLCARRNDGHCSDFKAASRRAARARRRSP